LSNSAHNSAFSAIFTEDITIQPKRDGLVSFGGPGPQYPIHRHNELEFNLVTRGRARYLLRDRQYHLRPGSLIWLFPEHDHVLLDRSPDYAHWIACFRPSMLASACISQETRALMETNPSGWFCEQISAEVARTIGRVLYELRSMEDAESDLFNAGLRYALLAAWRAFRRVDHAETTRDEVGMHPAVLRAVQLVRSMAISEVADEQNLSVCHIAERCDISADHLARLFKRDLGMGIVEFRNHERLRSFVRLYGNGRSRTLLETAIRVGFGSYAQFSRVFIEQMGVTPAQYRRMAGNG